MVRTKEDRSDPLLHSDAATGPCWLPLRDAGLSPSWASGRGGAVVLVGVLHVLPETAGISPVRQTISEYALTDGGWMFNVAAIAMAARVAGRVRRPGADPADAGRSAGAVLGALWVAALLVIVLFPKHNWAIGPSADGQIHRVASVVAFLCLPIAVMLLTRRPRSGGGIGRTGRRTLGQRSGWRCCRWHGSVR